MEEKEKTALVHDAEAVVDLEFPTEHVITVLTKFIEHFFNDKDFYGETSVQISKRRFNDDMCELTISLGRATTQQIYHS